MTLQVLDANVAAARVDIDELMTQVRELESPAMVTEARARIEAARAWAKVHGKTKALRLDLLKVEVEALVRMVELDGLALLPSSDRKAALFLARMSAAQREDFIAQSGGVTTAVGMCRAAWRDEELATWKRRARAEGRRLATDPGASDDDCVDGMRERVHGIRAALEGLLESYACEGEPFTIAELSDELLLDAASAVGLSDVDGALRRGVSEVCREAVRRSPVLKVEGTILPRFITARIFSSELGEDKFVRIPTENARVSHLVDMVALRSEQLRQDAASLDSLEQVLQRLRDMQPDGDPVIGELIAASIATAS